MDFTNYAALRAASIDDEDDVFAFDESLTIGQNVYRMLARQFCLPKGYLQIPILAGYLLMPTQLTSTVPILLLEGKEGTGKTDIMLFGSAFCGVQIQNAAWTYAALRNEITQGRNGDTSVSEKAYTLFLDNLNQETLKNEQLYTLLLCGYSRKSSVIKIAKPGGETISFDTYCPKLASTVHNLLGDPVHRELRRRCLVIRTKKWEETKKTDEVHSDFDPENYQALDGLGLSHLKDEYDSFWKENQNIVHYLTTKKRLNKQLKGFPLKGLLLDLITTMVVVGLFGEEYGTEQIEQFLDWQKETESDTALLNCLKNFIEEENRPYTEVGISIQEIIPKRLKDAVQFEAQNGALDCIPTPQLISQSMGSLGWILKDGKWRKTA